jgi:hypothetical protein
MHGNSFRFHASSTSEWKGRYKRIQGSSSAFHVVSRAGKYVILAYIQTEEGQVSCQALPCPDVEAMIEAINDVKRRYHSQPGGSFLINEFGQVLVPTKESIRFYVGQCTGVLQFLNLDTKRIVDLSDDSLLETGDAWDLPYVGMPYHLSIRNQLYFWDDQQNSKRLPQAQDKNLIRKIRSIRRHGGVRILVNPYGLVATKAPVGEFDFDEDNWKPVYIGRIDYAKWFAKEETTWRTGS